MKSRFCLLKLTHKKGSTRAYTTLMNVKLQDPESDYSAYLRIQRDEETKQYFIYMTNSNGYVLQRIDKNAILLIRDMLNLTIEHNKLSEISL